MANELLLNNVNQRHDNAIDWMKRRMAKRDNLYWNFRYRKGSYKARKMALQPILIMAKRGLEMIRVYGEAGEFDDPKKIAFATARFKAWGQKERELRRLQMPAYKKWLKDSHLKGNHFSYWLMNVAP